MGARPTRWWRHFQLLSRRKFVGRCEFIGHAERIAHEQAAQRALNLGVSHELIFDSGAITFVFDGFEQSRDGVAIAFDFGGF